MGIKDDLKEAKNGSSALVTVDLFLDELEKKEDVSRQEAARWLALKGVHYQVPAYFVDPLSYAREPLSLELDDLGVMHYKQVREVLNDVVYPPRMTGGTAIFQIQQMLGPEMAPRPETGPAWVRSEIEAFVSQDKGGDQVQDDMSAEDIENIECKTGIIQQRQEALFSYIRKQFDDVKAIPKGGKAELRKRLVELDARRFTDATFDKAWSVLSTGGRIMVEDKNIYTSRPEALPSDET